MNVGTEYKIESDELNVTLWHKIINKKGKRVGAERWEAIAYFSNVTNALDFIVDLKVNATGLKDLKTVVEKQRELYALIKSLELPSKPVESVRKPSK